MGMIVHRVGTAAQYAAIIEKDPDVLYWVEDQQRMYKGDVLYATGAEATSLLSGLMSSSDKIKLGKMRGGYSIPQRIRDHLFHIRYETYDYEDGYRFMERYRPRGACSVLRKGPLVGRNMDWMYTDAANFVVETKACNGRHATIGCALAGENLSNEAAESGVELEEYKYLPFIVNDVVNDCGVYASMNIVYPGDRGYTLGTLPGAQKLCQLMIPRFVADYADSARDALTLLSGMDIYAPLNGMSEECHILVCDEADSYIIEFIDNVMTIYSDTDPRYPVFPHNACMMTNFYLSGWNSEFKMVYAGNTAEEVAQTGINPHAMGIERYKLLIDQYDAIDSVDGVCRAMESVKYLKSYDLTLDPYWYSEFTGYTDTFGDLTVYSTAADYTGIIDYTQEAYRKFKRDGSIWITAHTSVYDLGARKLYVYVEEDYGHRFEFRLPVIGVSEDSVWESI